MKLHRIDWIKEFLVTQMNHWIVIMAVMTVMKFFDYPSPYLPLWLAVSVLPLFLYMVRCKVNHFYLFYLIHLLLPVGVIVLIKDGGVIKGLLFMQVILYVFLSIRHKLHSQEGEDVCLPPVLAACFGFAMYFLYDYQKGQAWNGYYVLAILIYLGFYFIYYYLDRYQSFLTFNKSSAANIPEKAMLRSGVAQITLFAMVAVGVMLLVSDLKWLDYMVYGAQLAFAAILKVLVSGRDAGPTEWAGTDAPVKGEGMPYFGESETAVIWIVLEYVAIALVAIGIAIGIVTAIIKGLAYLRNHFGTKQTSDSRKLDETNDIREYCAIEKYGRKSGGWFAIRDNKEKVRRLYKKKIERTYRQHEGQKDLSFLNWMTAQECCRVFEEDAVPEIYEKVRYSDEECTTEDVKHAKRLLS